MASLSENCWSFYPHNSRKIADLALIHHGPDPGPASCNKYLLEQPALFSNHVHQATWLNYHSKTKKRTWEFKIWILLLVYKHASQDKTAFIICNSLSFLLINNGNHVNPKNINSRNQFWKLDLRFKKLILRTNKIELRTFAATICIVYFSTQNVQMSFYEPCWLITVMY